MHGTDPHAEPPADPATPAVFHGAGRVLASSWLAALAALGLVVLAVTRHVQRPPGASWRGWLAPVADLLIVIALVGAVWLRTQTRAGHDVSPRAARAIGCTVLAAVLAYALGVFLP